ncbi:MAG: inner membrane CreD family protein [Coriobacteriia bacterium]|nr:inner membrane CreD family protein [Coriobacteriia bacterium]
MTVPRLVAIALIFVLAAGAWVVLAASVDFRTQDTNAALYDRVGGLWGESQTQLVPVFTAASGAEGASRSLSLDATTIDTVFDLDQRRKGLLWYATYTVDFAAEYRVSNPATTTVDARMEFPFPTPDGIYDGFTVRVDDAELPVTYAEGNAVATFQLPPGSTAVVQAGYSTNGLDEWRYLPTRDGVGVIKDFTLTMRTDFTDVDFPDDAVSPTSIDDAEDGKTLTWRYDSLVSGRAIALTMPRPMNPGPLASRISLFAPVSLLFYFAALVLLTATQHIRVHPVNYAFLAAGFFAFHLLFAYLVDRVDINVAFAIASIASVGLCVGYLRLVLGRGPALREIALSQFVFLVLFSYSFFFEGLTGLAVTIGSVLTLGYFMAKTGRVDWETVFARRARPMIGAPPISPDITRM